VAKQALKREAKRAPEPRRNLHAVGRNTPDTMHEIDRLIHERLRLGIISALAANESLTFNELKGLIKTSDGNLSVHARKLEDAGYVRCSKTFHGRTPKTEYKLTSAGRRALERYLDHMEAVIGQMRRQAS
jgi:DNA-binding HxlR family transcriptional regulator